jgi:centromeric protein E
MAATLSHVEPASVQVPVSDDAVESRSFTLFRNHSAKGDLAFKVKTTIPQQVRVKPGSGVLPASDAFVVVELQFTGFQGKGKVQVQVTSADGAVSDTHVLRLEPSTDRQALPPSPPQSAAVASPPEHPAAASTTVPLHRDPTTRHTHSNSTPLAAAPPPSLTQPSMTASNRARTVAEEESETPNLAIDRFDIELVIREIMATRASSSKVYLLRWKRGNATGVLPLVRGAAGRIELNASALIPNCKLVLKEDGQPARRLLHLTIFVADIEDDDDDGVRFPSADAMNEQWATVKIDTSAYVPGRREAELPLTLHSGSSGVLIMAVTMTPSGNVAPATASSVTGGDHEHGAPATTGTANTPTDTMPKSARSTDLKPSTPETPSGGPAFVEEVVEEAEVLHVSTRRGARRRPAVEAPPSLDFDFSVLGKAAAKGVFSGSDSAIAAGESASPLAATQSNVFVCVRVRPLLKRIEGGELGWTIGSDNRSLIATNEAGAKFEFDRVIAPTDNNARVYELVAPRFIDGVADGINGTIFMYGQTASGKTHTMFGEAEETGITQLVVQAVFEKLGLTLRERAAEGKSMKAIVQVAYFEVYNEELNDLLDVSKKNLVVRASKEGGGFSADTVYRNVPDATTALAVLREGSENKKMGQSMLNDRSSRSHSIFRLRVKTQLELSDGKSRVTTAELNLVDLAGSESLSEKGDDTNKKETSHINLSLSYLKKVIGELAHQSSFVSYRNSVLTKILKQALGGNSRTTVICCITPAVEHFKDSRNTLAFGTTARAVILTARANTSDSGGGPMSAAAREHLRRLQAQMLGMKSAIEAYQAIEKDYDEVADENERLAAKVEKLQVLLQRARQQIQQMRNDIGGTGALAEAVAVGAPAHSTTVTEDQRHEMPGEDAFEAVDVGPEVHAHDETALHFDDDAFETVDVGADGDDPREFDDALDVPIAPESAVLSQVPRTRPTTTGAAGVPRINEAQILRRELNRLRVEHRAALVTKNEELQRAVEDANAAHGLAAAASRGLISQIPEVKAKDAKVATLLDQIDSFLRYGTAVLHLTENSKTKVLSLASEHLCVAKDSDSMKGGGLVRCGRDDKGNRVRSDVLGTISFKDVKRMELGQDGEGFKRIVTQFLRTIQDLERKALCAKTPEEADGFKAEAKRLQDDITQIRRLQRCSFTIVLKKKKFLDVICLNAADFEVWVVGMNRILPTSAEWPHKMDVAKAPSVEELDDEERDFCATLHIFPKEYLRARNALFAAGPRLLTLFDMRTSSGLDLYHAQRFFYFSRCRGWIDAASVFFLCPDAVEETFEDVGGTGADSAPVEVSADTVVDDVHGHDD